MADAYDLLTLAHERAMAFLNSLPERPVAPGASFERVLEALGGPLPDASQDSLAVLGDLSARLEPGLTANAGPRYFGFVTGGSYPVAVAADWLVSAWDQNAALHIMSPAMSALEVCTARWILDALGLPEQSSVGFVTGAHTANITALAAARHEVLRRARWDVEALGLQGAPPLTVIAGAEAHSSIDAACRMIGVGSRTIMRVATDEQGRMRTDALEWALSATSGPTIVCAQVGNVNTGACDPLVEIGELTRENGAWLHIDGAFGLWAAASPGVSPAGRRSCRCRFVDDRRTQVAERSVRQRHRHRSPSGCPSRRDESNRRLPDAGEGAERDGTDWVPEASRRARAVPIYAVLRMLGRSGLAALVDRCCRHAVRMSDRLWNKPGVQVLNEVVLNQVLARFSSPSGENITNQVIAAVQAAGVCWCGGTMWAGEPAMRISVSNWRTSEDDIDRSAASILRSGRTSARRLTSDDRLC